MMASVKNLGQRKNSWPLKKKKSSPRLGAAVFDLAKKGSIIQGHNKKNENLGLHKKKMTNYGKRKKSWPT